MKYSEKYREMELAGLAPSGPIHQLLFTAIDEIVQRLDDIQNKTKPKAGFSNETADGDD